MISADVIQKSMQMTFFKELINILQAGQLPIKFN